MALGTFALYLVSNTDSVQAQGPIGSATSGSQYTAFVSSLGRVVNKALKLYFSFVVKDWRLSVCTDVNSLVRSFKGPTGGALV